jgi:hypothetical protein
MRLVCLLLSMLFFVPSASAEQKDCDQFQTIGQLEDRLKCLQQNVKQAHDETASMVSVVELGVDKCGASGCEARCGTGILVFGLCLNADGKPQSPSGMTRVSVQCPSSSLARAVCVRQP